MNAFLQSIAKEAPDSKRARYLVGVSGGRDSVVLLESLLTLGFKKLLVCHLDHGLRGRAATDDRKFVERLAVRHGLQWIVKRSDVARYAQERRLSLETAAREARYDFFKEVGKVHRCSRVFLGHHADDLAETFLFNLLRGSGLAGLIAMKPVSKIGSLTVLRPLLGVSRDEIDSYAKEHGIRFREDASNADPRHTRNRLRHEALPLLNGILGRDVAASIRRTVQILRPEEEWIASLPELVPVKQLRVSDVAALPLPLQRRLLKRWLDLHEIPDAGFVEVERVRSLLEMNKAKVNLPGAKYARRRAGVLFIE